MFAFEIDFGNHSWCCASMKNFVNFEKEATNIPVDSCAGLLDITDQQRKIINDLIEKYAEPPGEILKATNLKKQVIDVHGHEPIRQRMRRYSPKMLKKA